LRLWRQSSGRSPIARHLARAGGGARAPGVVWGGLLCALAVATAWGLAATPAGAQGRGTIQPSVARPEGGAWSAAVKQAPGAGPRARAISFKISGDQGRTHVRMSITQQVAANMFLLDAPYRAIIDIPELDFQFPPAASSQAAGLVKAFRYGQFGAGRSRVVIDLSGPARVEKAQFTAPGGIEPGVLSFDLVKIGVADFSAMLGAQPASTPEAHQDPGLRSGRHEDAQEIQRNSAVQGQKGKPVIVIDPGHGGIDPGAVASATATEKVVTLAVATQVRQLLMQGRRYEVHLTRQSDVFISLDQRVRVSRQLAADLFVSIHADSLAEKEFAQAINGATIYTLSDRASDERAGRMAEKENSADVLAGLAAVPASAEDQVRNILFDLVQRETANYSISFRNLLLGHMRGKVPLAKDPQRSAAFKVLRQAETPAVLIELGYMSNAQDLERLVRPDGQRQLAQTIATSIDAFFAQKASKAK
jgi:N-acetylmuramoyl-L-alanine amidase